MKVSHLSQCIKDISSFQSSVDDPSCTFAVSDVQDLNIINLHEECYNVTLHFHGGRTMTAKRCQLDLFGDDRPERVCLQDEHGRDQLIVEFDPRMCVYDYERHATIVPEEALSLDYIEYYEEETVAEIKKLVPDYLSLTRAAERNLHYLTA